MSPDMESGREAVSLFVQMGIKLAEFKEMGCLETVASNHFSLSTARAELLIRLASARPTWVIREAVDLADPIALELILTAQGNALEAVEIINAAAGEVTE